MAYEPTLYIDGYVAPAVTTFYAPTVHGAYTAAQLGDAGNGVNTTGKTAGKRVWDSTNKRVMEASGSAATDEWDALNGSASITPQLSASDWSAILDSLQSETDGLILYFLDSTSPRALVRDTVTPANNFDGDANDVMANYAWPQLRRREDGDWGYGLHNVIKYSDVFGDAASGYTWGVAGVSVSSAAGTDVRGNPCDKLVTYNGSGGLNYLQTIPSFNVPSKVALEVKADGADWVGLGFDTGGNIVGFDLAAGTVSYDPGGSYVATISALGSGWYRITFKGPAVNGYRLRIFVSDTAITTGNFAMTGDGTKGVLLTRACMFAASSDDAFLETNGRPVSELPIKYDSGGTALGLQKWRERTNFFQYSQDIGGGWWTVNNGSFSSVAGAPDGSATAQRFTASGSGGLVRFYRLSVPTDDYYVYGLMVKAASGIPYIHMWAELDGVPYGICINTSTGAITTGYSSSGVAFSAPASSDTEDMGDGWHRVQMTVNCIGKATTNFIVNFSDSATTSNSGFSGGETVDLWALQGEQNLLLGPYIATRDGSNTRKPDQIEITADKFNMSDSENTWLIKIGEFIANQNHPAVSVFTAITDDGTNYQELVARGRTDLVLTYQYIDSPYSELFPETGDDSGPFTPGATTAIAVAMEASTRLQLAYNGTADTATTVDVPLPLAWTSIQIGGYYDASLDNVEGLIQYFKHIPRAVSEADLISETS